MKDLDGKLVLVTGAASGIGRATATAFAAAGARLLISDVDEAGLGSLAAELGPRCALSRRVDVSDRTAMAAHADEVHALAPAVDVVVNNAGVGLHGTMLTTSLDHWDWVLRINLGGVIHGCHYFVPKMVERGSGHVVNVSSVLGYFAAPGAIGYVTSKFAVLGLTLALRAELSGSGVGVTAICPGMINTNIMNTTRFADSGDERLRERIAKTFRRRGYSPERVAASIVAAVKGDRAIAPVSPESWAMWAASRMAPSLVARVSGLVEQRVIRMQREA